LHAELQSIGERPDHAVFHDELEENNAPVYFHQFAEHAARHGLQYLSEADFVEIQIGVCPPHVVEVLKQVSSNRIAQEQYLDFLKGRRFRQTLLCHAGVELDDEPRISSLRRFSVFSPLRPEATPVDCSSRDTAVFLGTEGKSIKTDNPLMKAALFTLSQAWPHALPFNDLLDEARALGGRGSVQNGEELFQDIRVLATSLLRAYAGTIIEFHVFSPRFLSQPSERPVVSPLARLQARGGKRVTNLRHENLSLEGDLDRHLLQLLDGSHDRPALLAELSKLIETGIFTVQKDGESVPDLETARQIIATELEDKLVEIGRSALLVA
jgi:methyltransferase-like protein